MPYPSPSGSTNGYSPLPDGWSVSVVNGQYTISYNGQPVQQSNLSGTMLANSVTTGVGSFHLGQAHAIGSAGQNVTFKNNQTNVCWFPVWQGQSADGATIYNPQARTFQAQQTLKINGEVNLSGTPVPYMVTDTMTGNLSFTSILLYPSETYAGALTWTVTYTPSGIQVANVKVTGCTSGTLLTIPLEYPLDARTGDSFTVTITKEDGSTLNAYPGTTRPTEAYRGLVCRPFTDSIVWNQSNIGTGLKVSGSNLAVDPAQIDATQLLNISQVSSGGYVGAINFAGGLAQFANAQKNQYWQANTAGTIGGLTFAVGDNLICVASITGTPANLNNSSWAIRANVSAIASSTQLGQVKPTDGLSIDSSGTLTTKLGTGLAYDGAKAVTINPAQIDVTTLNKADTLVNGIYKGGLNATSTLATLTNAVKGNWWNVSAAVTISGTAFGVGDQLWCQTAVTGVPVDLTNFTRVPATMAQATTTATGTVQLAGDFGGTATAPKVLKINGVTISGTPAAGQVPLATSATNAAWSTLAGNVILASYAGTNAFAKNEIVIGADGCVYTANAAIPANTAFATGISGATFKNVGAILGDIKQSLKSADHQGWILLDGRSVSTLTATQKTAAADLGYGTGTFLPDARGRYLGAAGSAFGSITGGSNTIAQANLPNIALSGTTANNNVGHTHSIDPPSTTSSNGTDHTHYVDLSTLAGTGNHEHTYQRMGSRGASGTDFTVGNGTNTNASTTGTGEHGHTVRGNTNVGTAHTHTVDIPSFTSGDNSASHTHTYSVNLNGNVTQTVFQPQYLALNTFVYLGV